MFYKSLNIRSLISHEQLPLQDREKRTRQPFCIHKDYVVCCDLDSFVLKSHQKQLVYFLVDTERNLPTFMNCVICSFNYDLIQNDMQVQVPSMQENMNFFKIETDFLFLINCSKRLTYTILVYIFIILNFPYA